MKKNYWSGIFTGGILGMLLGAALIGSTQKGTQRAIMKTATRASGNARRWAIKAGKDLGQAVDARIRRI